MTTPQQDIINALVGAFATATSLDVYDTIAPQDTPFPFVDLVTISDATDDFMPAGPTNSAHGLTFELRFWVDRKVGPASLRSYGQLALSLHQTTLPAANDGPNVVRCVDRGAPQPSDNNTLLLTQTWFYQGGT